MSPLTNLIVGVNTDTKVRKLFGVYLLNSAPALLPMIYSWNSANTSGYTKRTMRNALTLMAFCIGNLIGPQLFNSGLPDYQPAKIVLLVTVAAVVVLILCLRQVMAAENKKRENEFGSDGGILSEKIEIHDLTDIENRRTFRYVY